LFFTVPSDRRKSCSTASGLIMMFKCRTRACSMRSEIKMYKIPRKTSNFPWDYLLFANLNSTVPSYADEFKLTKYNFLFRNLPACRWVYRHAEGTVKIVFYSPLILRLFKFYKCKSNTFNY